MRSEKCRQFDQTPDLAGVASVPGWVSGDARIVVPARRSSLMEDELDGEGLLVDPVSGRTHRMNATALQLWRLCDGVRTTRQLAEALTCDYEVSFDTALDHIEQLVVLFAESGLLELSDEGCGAGDSGHPCESGGQASPVDPEESWT